MGLKKFIYISYAAGILGYAFSLFFSYYIIPFSSEPSALDILWMVALSLVPCLISIFLLSYVFYKPITKASSFKQNFKRSFYYSILVACLTGVFLFLLDTFFSRSELSLTYGLIYVASAFLYGLLGALLAALLLSALTYRSNKVPDNLS